MKIRMFFVSALLMAAALLSAPAGAAVLLVQDQYGCGDNAIEPVLNSWGVSYKVSLSAEIPAFAGLNKFDTIVIAAHQGRDFYRNLDAAMPRITRWLKSGPHTLQFHAASGCGEVGYSLILPRGVVTAGPQWNYDTNRVKARLSPLVVGVPAAFGPYADIWTTDHTFDALGKVITVDSSGAPTTIDYCVGGTGRVIATGLNVERFYTAGVDSAALLTNMLSASVYTPGCQQSPPQ